MLRRLLPASLLFVLICFGSAAHAATVGASNEYTLPPGQTNSGNLYIAGGHAVIAGHVSGELVVAGGSVDLTGTVDQSVTVLGGTVAVDGPVGGSLHVLGGHVTVNSAVVGDLLAGAGTVEIPAGGTVGGDAIVATGHFTLSGKVNGDVRVIGGPIRIEGTVGGTLYAESNDITLTESAQIGRDFRYKSTHQAAVSPAAKIGGTTDYTHRNSSNYGAFSALGLLFRLILLYVAALVLIALFMRKSESVTYTFDKHFFQAILIGFGFVILAPIVGILLFLTIVGVYLAIMLLLAYLLILLLGVVYGAMSLGYVVVKRFGDGPMSPYLFSLIGVALIVLLSAIPVIGSIAVFILMLSGAGSILLLLFDRGSREMAAPALSEPQAVKSSTKPRRRSVKRTGR